VSAIVLNWNGGAHVLDAVRSLLEQDAADLEVIVVDNGSSDGSDTAVENRFGARVRLLRNGCNLGYGAGNNVGIRAASGRYVLLLNNDACADPGLVRELVLAAGRKPHTGMVAAKVLDYTRRDVIDTVGHLMYPDGLNRGRGRLEHDGGQYDGCSEALFPSGAAALYDRAMLDEIGVFDESFFLYGDDAELGMRGRVAGWRCAFAPAARAFHRYSAAAGTYSTLKAFYVERNRVLVLVKLFPWTLILLSPLYTLARLALQAFGAISGRGAAARLASQRSPIHLAAVTLAAYVSALRLLPRALRERARIAKTRRLTTWQFLELLDRFRMSAVELALKD
jgi:GT2 family glycosyltransferase